MKQNRDIVWATLAGFSLLLLVFGVTEHFKLETIKAEKRAAIEAWRIKLNIEQAKADQAYYRAMEVGFLCEFSARSGEIYLNKNCE